LLFQIYYVMQEVLLEVILNGLKIILEKIGL